MKKLFVLLLMGQLFFSCAKKDSTSSSSDDTSADLDSLQGTWKTNCHSSDSLYRILSISINSTDVTINYEYHSDASCNTDYAIFVDTYDSLSLGTKMEFTNSTAEGRQFTINVKKFTLAPQDSALVTSYNNNTHCGYNDWVINEFKDIHGKTCGTTSYAVSNTTVNSVYGMTGNNLMLGELNTTGEAQTVIYTTPLFVKQ